MVCYIVPLFATIFYTVFRKASGRNGVHGFWLNIMMFGGAMFGVIDHLWFGELFMIGTNWIADIALGGTITAGIFSGWALIVYKDHLAQPTRFITRITGMHK